MPSMQNFYKHSIIQQKCVLNKKLTVYKIRDGAGIFQNGEIDQKTILLSIINNTNY